MIPADSPPSFDAQREETYATIPLGGAVLQRLDQDQPQQSGVDH